MWRKFINRIKGNMEFQGNNFLFNCLALFFIAIYFIYFGTNQPVILLGDHNPYISWWYVFAVAAFACAGISLYSQKIVTCRFVSVSSSIILIFFFALQYILYRGYSSIVPESVSVLIGIVCLWRLIKEKRVGLSWLLPIILVLSLLIIRFLSSQIILSNISFVLGWIVTIIIFMGITSYFDTSKSTKKTKVCIFGVSICYILLATYVYCEFNPLLTYKLSARAYTSYYWNNTKPHTLQGTGLKGFETSKWNFADLSIYDICSKETSLISREGDKWVLVDGKSWGKKIIDNKFDFYGYDPSCKLYSVAFNLNKDNKWYSPTEGEPSLFPISLNDSLIAFPASASFYKSLYDYKSKGTNSQDAINARNSLSSSILFDYINAFQYRDKQSLSRLKVDYGLLKKELLKLSTDSSAFVQTYHDNDVIYNPDQRVHLGNMTQNMTLGILTALSLDLLEKDNLEGAITIFSYQFLITFYNDVNIYGDLPVGTHINLDLNLGNKPIIRDFSITRAKLTNFTDIDNWANAFQFSISLALKINFDHSSLEAEETLYSIIERGAPLELQEQKDLLDRINSELNNLVSYKNMPNTADFLNSIRSYLYSCIIRDYYPSYNSFFLSRYSDICDIQLSQKDYSDEYNQIRNIYEKNYKEKLSKLDYVFKQIDSIGKQIDKQKDEQQQLAKRISTAIDDIEDPEIRKRLEEILDQIKF